MCYRLTALMKSAVVQTVFLRDRSSRPGRSCGTALLVAALALAPVELFAQAAGGVVISQVFGGGGNNGAPFRNDFVELFNRGTESVSLTGWTVQYASSASANWQAAPLNGQLAPGQYFLVQFGSGGSSGIPVPAPDGTGSISLAASAGKVALVRSTALLSGACPTNGDLVDLVGYGANASCYEGSGPAASPANAVAVHRASAGCHDSDDNSHDFYVAAPDPRNRNSSIQLCAGNSTPTPLHGIQGAAAQSFLAGEFVITTTNIVTAVVDDGFFLQARDPEADDDPTTSEAVFVATTAVPPVSVGNALVVSGVVAESGNASPGAPTRTQIINPMVTLIAGGQPLPTEVAFDNPEPPGTGGIDPFERYEGMRVRTDSLTVVAPTEGFLIEADAQGISDGVFYGVLAGTPRPMREPGIPLFDLLPLDAPAGVPRFDNNPERLRVDSNTQPGAPRLEVTTGATLSNLVGVIDFADDVWTLYPDPGGSPMITGNIVAIPVPSAASNEFTVASFNLERFFDSIDDPGVDETVLTATAFSGRLNKASLAIRNVLRAPHILGVVEVENLPTLQALAAKVNSDAIAAGQPNPRYGAWLLEGNDIGGIDVGFLIRTSHVSVFEVLQFGKTNTYVNPINGQPETLNDRPPLLLRASAPRSASSIPLPVTVILNHLRSMSGIANAADGPRIRAKRRAQAEYLAALVQDRQTSTPEENLILIGDFNAFEFNDGYADLLGTIKGTPTPSNVVTLASPDLVQPDLVNLIDELSPEQRYSFTFDGNAQTLDHILVGATVHRRLTRLAFARNNADFPESFRSNFNRPERVSDHDAPVAFVASSLPPRLLSIELATSATVQLGWLAEPMQTNRVERSTNLRDWTTDATVVTDPDGRGAHERSTGGPDSQQFYRIALP
jgi:predicted extracellular nuclease